MDGLPGAADQTQAERAERLSNRAFGLAVFSLFLPFLGLILGFVALGVALAAQSAGRRAGVRIGRSSVVFSLVAIAVWTVLWLMILLPAYFTSRSG